MSSSSSSSSSPHLWTNNNNNNNAASSTTATGVGGGSAGAAAVVSAPQQRLGSVGACYYNCTVAQRYHPSSYLPILQGLAARSSQHCSSATVAATTTSATAVGGGAVSTFTGLDPSHLFLPSSPSSSCDCSNSDKKEGEMEVNDDDEMTLVVAKASLVIGRIVWKRMILRKRRRIMAAVTSTAGALGMAAAVASGKTGGAGMKRKAVAGVMASLWPAISSRSSRKRRKVQTSPQQQQQQGLASASAGEGAAVELNRAADTATTVTATTSQPAVTTNPTTSVGVGDSKMPASNQPPNNNNKNNAPLIRRVPWMRQQEHWIWNRLDSYLAAERSVAVHMLLTAVCSCPEHYTPSPKPVYPHPQQTTTPVLPPLPCMVEDSRHHFHWKLIERTVERIDDCIQQLIHCSASTNNSSHNKSNGHLDSDTIAFDLAEDIMGTMITGSFWKKRNKESKEYARNPKSWTARLAVESIALLKHLLFLDAYPYELLQGGTKSTAAVTATGNSNTTVTAESKKTNAEQQGHKKPAEKSTAPSNSSNNNNKAPPAAGRSRSNSNNSMISNASSCDKKSQSQPSHQKFAAQQEPPISTKWMLTFGGGKHMAGWNWLCRCIFLVATVSTDNESPQDCAALQSVLYSLTDLYQSMTLFSTATGWKADEPAKIDLDQEWMQTMQKAAQHLWQSTPCTSSSSSSESENLGPLACLLAAHFCLMQMQQQSSNFHGGSSGKHPSTSPVDAMISGSHQGSGNAGASSTTTTGSGNHSHYFWSSTTERLVWLRGSKALDGARTILTKLTDPSETIQLAPLIPSAPLSIANNKKHELKQQAGVAGKNAASASSSNRRRVTTTSTSASSKNHESSGGVLANASAAAAAAVSFLQQQRVGDSSAATATATTRLASTANSIIARAIGQWNSAAVAAASQPHDEEHQHQTASSLQNPSRLMSIAEHHVQDDEEDEEKDEMMLDSAGHILDEEEDENNDDGEEESGAGEAESGDDDEGGGLGCGEDDDNNLFRRPRRNRHRKREEKIQEAAAISNDDDEEDDDDAVRPSSCGNDHGAEVVISQDGTKGSSEANNNNSDRGGVDSSMQIESHLRAVAGNSGDGDDDDEDEEDGDDDEDEDDGNPDLRLNYHNIADDEDDEDIESTEGGEVLGQVEELCADDDDTVVREEDDDDVMPEACGGNGGGDGGGDDNDEDGDDEEEDDDDEEDDELLEMHEEDDDDDAMEIDLDEFAAASAVAAAAAASSNSSNAQRQVTKDGKKSSASSPNLTCPLSPSLEERKKMYIKSSMQVLAVQYPLLHSSLQHQQQVINAASNHGGPARRSLLNLGSECSLLEAVNKIIKPPKKPLHTKIIMRRAPTQEEFFRGSLSRNPISVCNLKPSRSTSAGTGGGADYEPTVADLRQHIADDLQMSDSAELIEILVANKILDVNLKLRVVHQVLWKNHLVENASLTVTGSALSSYLSGSSGPSFFSNGSGLSMILSSGFGDRIAGRNITADTPLSALPPMVATYRLAGVDGEATEDTVDVNDLVDPEAPASSANSEEVEKLMEQEYGLTRLVTGGRGVFVLLRSIQYTIMDTLRRIRRDDVGWVERGKGQNPSRIKFKQSPPCPGLTLLRYCCKLGSNRKKMLQARAPTVLLTLLLDVLKALEEPASPDALTSSSSSGSNQTADILQELIESLTSDISTAAENETTDEGGFETDAAQDAAGMPLLLESIETIALSSPLRNVIAKLLPFLTYGQADLSRQLAQHFDRHIPVNSLADCENEKQAQTKSSILMNTFVQTAVSMPPNEVCNSLRLELINCGFIDRLVSFICAGMPKQPPTWSPALWSKEENILGGPKRNEKDNGKQTSLEDEWRRYYTRGGMSTAFKILTGLCKKHPATQGRVAGIPGFLIACHWLESTSDNFSVAVDTHGLGLLAETLLDEMMDGNDQVAAQVEAVRKKTRLRKKELAQERRTKTLGKMGSFGQLPSASIVPTSGAPSSRSIAASMLGPVLDFFRDSSSTDNQSEVSKPGKEEKPEEKKPAWLSEMENMEDETGLTCAVCQEGRTLQPSELLGMYCYVKKVSIPLDQCGARSSIDGTVLLKALPATLPAFLVGKSCAEEWFTMGKAAGEDLSSTASSSLCVGSSGGRRSSLFTTTVSAGNGIHFSCHRKARQADRSHPKAPKSEWEGANLRNNRVNCNVILPLVSSRSSKVPLMAVDSALTEHQAAVSNLLGTTPKSMLWTVLHDVRFLLLRMAYGEALNTDCGGGSLSSNSKLLFYQLLMADMFDKDAQVDQPGQSQHARCLSAGFLAACCMVTASEYKSGNSSLTRGIADAAPMACLTSILFHNGNGNDDNEDSGGTNTKPQSKPQWVSGKDYFLRGLLICGGRRHALGIENSGCFTGRNAISCQRSASFVDWQTTTTDETSSRNQTACAANAHQPEGSRTSKATIEDFQNAVRPMVTLYAIFNSLANEFLVNMEDVQIQASSEKLMHAIEKCHRSKDIYELIASANISMSPGEMIEHLQKGMVSA